MKKKYTPGFLAGVLGLFIGITISLTTMFLMHLTYKQEIKKYTENSRRTLQMEYIVPLKNKE